MVRQSSKAAVAIPLPNFMTALALPVQIKAKASCNLGNLTVIGIRKSIIPIN